MPKKKNTKKQRICKVVGCHSPYDARDFCKKHYGRWHRYGNPLQRCKGDANDYVIKDNIVYMNSYNTQHEKVCTFLIDKIDLPKVSQHCWYLKNPGYITASIKGKDIYLHRFLTQAKSNEIIDHDNRNRLDCRQQNLKKGDYFLNAQNVSVSKTNKLNIKGVTKRILKSGGLRFDTSIMRYGKRYTKSCKTIEEAQSYYKKIEVLCEKI